MEEKLQKKELELKAKFETEKANAMNLEKEVVQKTELLKKSVERMNDLRAQYRLIQELNKTE